MKKDYSSKALFFIKKGYSADLVNFVCDLDPGKHFHWFISTLKQFMTFDDKLKDQCLLILNMAQKNATVLSGNFESALTDAIEFKKFEENYDSRVLHTFENGHHIYLIPFKELPIEGKIMSNCLSGYRLEVKEGRCAILSLRDKNKTSLANIQVLKNGSISQNFEKSNRQVKFSNWKYISEFFTLFGKDLHNIPNLENKSGLTSLTIQGGKISLPMIAQGIPTSLKTFINNNNEVVTNVESMAFTKIVEGTNIDPINEFGSAEEIINHLDNLQKKMIESIDRLKTFAIELEGKHFFLNDDLKRKIFGDNFLLKDEVKNIAELVSSFSSKNYGRQDELIRVRENIGRLREDIGVLRNGIAPLIDQDLPGNPMDEVEQIIRDRMRNIHHDEILDEMNPEMDPEIYMGDDMEDFDQYIGEDYWDEDELTNEENDEY